MPDCDRADLSNAIRTLDQQQLAKYFRSCFSRGGTQWLIEALKNSTDQELQQFRGPLLCCLCGGLRESGSAVDSSLLTVIANKYKKWRVQPVWAIINPDHETGLEGPYRDEELQAAYLAALGGEMGEDLVAAYASPTVDKPRYTIMRTSDGNEKDEGEELHGS